MVAEIGGATPGTFDVVNVSGLAAISGQLHLALLNGFVPATSDTYTVLTTAVGIFGSFSNVANGHRLTTLDSLGSFIVHYGADSPFNPNHVVLSAFEPAELPSDFNFDGTIDAADYVTWRKGLGTTHTEGGFNVWRTHFAETGGLGAAESSNMPAVPEPAPLALVMLAAIALNFIARRRAFVLKLRQCSPIIWEAISQLGENRPDGRKFFAIHPPTLPGVASQPEFVS